MKTHINAQGLLENEDGTIPGSVIQVWKPTWNAWHFGIVAEGSGMIHYIQDNPTCFVEVQIGHDKEWLRCPIEDYEFIRRSLGNSVEVRSRPC